MSALNRLRKRREREHFLFSYRMSAWLSRRIFRYGKFERNVALERYETLTDELRRDNKNARQ